jgi:hypothetical protein
VVSGCATEGPRPPGLPSDHPRHLAYSTAEQSSRGIERHCRHDIACRAITANRVPDHATVARFIVRHEQQLGELFSLVLKLCAKGGLVASGVVAIDGTKLVASALGDSNVDYDRIARGIIGEAIKTDQDEDEEHGDRSTVEAICFAASGIGRSLTDDLKSRCHPLDDRLL